MVPVAWTWAAAGSAAFLLLVFVVILPVYTLFLALLTIARSYCYNKWAQAEDESASASASSSCRSGNNLYTSLFQGRVFHIRHQPTVHSFKYPLYFSVVDLNEASDLWASVLPLGASRHDSTREKLWPLSTLMRLRDIDHMKNGEGIPDGARRNLSLVERLYNLLHERTNGKFDLRPTLRQDGGHRHKIVLVTHLMYYGYCFNPVSFYFVVKTSANDQEEDEIEAIVVEVSNTPWNEMSIYVLHPNSIDILEHAVTKPAKGTTENHMNTSTHRYKWRKNFHVSPFMTMDHDYDWIFQLSSDRIKVEMKMIKKPEEASGEGVVFFSAGFDVRRTITPSWTYPLQFARVISRFPIYCFIIQVWIHYEALRLLMKGVSFIPHPEGSETAASKAIEVTMRPIFAVMEVIRAWMGQQESAAVDKTKGE
ncbi:hypothetical protein THAOC_10007 [Thalassiosira oceanica]|uniref:Uncharacterized protein n=1 Tax=Thalassiosira oceanica TaxID=159749 RepID=K0TE15_THAOC|nr:hypothetical protein THAOC_10007 [Thalassiosira oceanica]|eukprot:EJK68787.1 hypothetical protein THAOC_10007 [Thalassiosira oceanica]